MQGDAPRGSSWDSPRGAPGGAPRGAPRVVVSCGMLVRACELLETAVFQQERARLGKENGEE